MNAQKGCCDWLFRCFKGNSETKEKDNIHQDNSPPNQKTMIVEHPSQENNQINSNSRNRPPEPANDNTNIIQNQEIEFNFPTINTKFNRDQIVCNVTPDKLKEIRYNCPICFKFYNHILVLECCRNYICLPCINDYIETSKKYNSILKCPICTFSEKLILEDVDPSSQIKLYTDTLYGSVKRPLKKDKTIIKNTLTRKETDMRRAYTKQHKFLKRKYSIENGVLFDINRNSGQTKKELLKSQTIQNLKKNPTRKKDYYDQTGVINKPELKNTVEIDNIEINFKKEYRSRSKLNQSISHQSAYSFCENNFEINSQIDDEDPNGEFYFERDNDNNLIEILEMRIQNDIINHEQRRKNNQVDSDPNFHTVKLNEMESKSQGENHSKTRYLRQNSIEYVLKNTKTEVQRMDVYIDENMPIDEDNNENDEHKEIDDINDIVDFEQIVQGSSPANSKIVEDKSENPSIINVERSDDRSKNSNLNKTEKVRFDTVSKKFNFDVLNID